MHDFVTENRGNLFCMKAVNKLINNAPGIQTGIYIYILYCTIIYIANTGKLWNPLRIYENGEM